MVSDMVLVTILVNYLRDRAIFNVDLFFYFGLK